MIVYCLWLKGVLPLFPTKIMEKRIAKVHYMSPGPERSKLRSKIYSSIAEAMANQWG